SASTQGRSGKVRVSTRVRELTSTCDSACCSVGLQRRGHRACCSNGYLGGLNSQSVLRNTLASRRQRPSAGSTRQFCTPTAYGSARGSSWRAANLRFVLVACSGETSLVGWTRRPDQDVGSLPAVLAQVAQPVLAHLRELDLVAVWIDDRRDERGRA